MIIPLFMPHGGCPERCTFCDQGVSGGEPIAPGKIRRTIEEYLATGRLPADVAFYGGTFTALARPRQIAALEAVRPYLESGQVAKVRLATRPDAIEENWIKELSERYKIGVIELGVQSFHEPSLRLLGRSHGNAEVERAVEVLRNLKLDIGLHLMIGCPGEPESIDELTLSMIQKLKPKFVRLHPLLVLSGTPLADLWREGKYVPLSLETALQRAAFLTEQLEDALGVKVIRLGLQANELLGAAVVAGPYHPGFGDLVRGRMAYEKIARQIGNLAPPPRSILEITLPERSLSQITGPAQSNLKALKIRFGLSEIRLNVLKGHSKHDHTQIRIHHSAGLA